MQFDNSQQKRKKILFYILIISSLLTISSILIYRLIKQDEGEICNIADIDFQSLNMNDVFYKYEKQGYKTIIGVDLSEHNKDIDFNKLKELGIEFVFLRVGWRGYQNPELHLDIRFEEYYKKAKEVNIKVGVYFFSQATNENEAIEEAQFVIDNIKNKKIDTYVAYDCETITPDKARTDTITKHQRTINARSFLAKIEKEGYSPLLYTNLDWIRNHYEFMILREYPIWYAQYTLKPQYKGEYIIWQYSGDALIEEISKENKIDLNLMIKKRGY